jgi:hypothetical protein
MSGGCSVKGWFACVGLAILIAIGPASGAEPLGELTSVDGSVILTRGKSRYKNPSPGMAIQLGDWLETLANASMVVRYPDGAILSFKPNTTVMLAHRKITANGRAALEREIHVTIGKVHYQRGKDDAVTLKLISTTTAANFSGESVVFETDGVFTYVNGREALLGDLMSAPDVTAAGGEHGKAAESLEHDYVESIKSLLK